MPPSRDAFGLALNALRQRLRQGVDAPGAPLPIHLIAAELGLSPTPVREALSRLAGEELVDKQGAAYTRPRLDALILAELYNLRLTYVAAALSAQASHRASHRDSQRAGRGPWPAREPFSLSADLARPGGDPTKVVAVLLQELVLCANDLVLTLAFGRAAERLAPFAPIEARIFSDIRAEALGLVSAFETGQARALRAAVRLHHRRRMDAAPTIVRLAEAQKYRPDIV